MCLPKLVARLSRNRINKSNIEFNLSFELIISIFITDNIILQVSSVSRKTDIA